MSSVLIEAFKLLSDLVEHTGTHQVEGRQRADGADGSQVAAVTAQVQKILKVKNAEKDVFIRIVRLNLDWNVEKSAEINILISNPERQMI